MFTAHINHDTLKEQSVKEHLYNVSAMAKEYSAKVSFAAAGELAGILHDMGKATNIFDSQQTDLGLMMNVIKMSIERNHHCR